MSQEILKTVLTSLDSPLSGSFQFDDICGWPECALSTLEEIGILKRGGNAQSVTCDGCGEACIEDVEFSQDGDGGLAAYVVCRERDDIGRVSVAPERLRTWVVSIGGLAALIARELGSNAKELIPDRLWLIGRVEIGGVRTECLLARGLAWPDGERVLREARSRMRGQAAVVLVSLRTSGGAASDGSLEMVALDEVLRLDCEGLHIEMSAIQGAASCAHAALVGASSGRPEECRFRPDGQRWSVIYDRKHISLNHSDGATYIAYLLEHPNASLHVRELYAIAHSQTRDYHANPYADMGSEELAEEDLYLDNERSPTDKRDDAELFATYRQSLDDLKRELIEARRKGDFRSADELQAELDNLNRLMSAEFGLGGQPRQPGDPNKLAYDRVSKAIARALKAIQSEHPTLSAHLTNAIHYEKFTYWYSPEHPIDWDM